MKLVLTMCRLGGLASKCMLVCQWGNLVCICCYCELVGVLGVLVSICGSLQALSREKNISEGTFRKNLHQASQLILCMGCITCYPFIGKEGAKIMLIKNVHTVSVHWCIVDGEYELDMYVI